MNDKEKIKKAAMFIDSFLVRTNTNLKKCASSKDLPEKESVIEILESQKRVLEKIKEILTSQPLIIEILQHSPIIPDYIETLRNPRQDQDQEVVLNHIL